MTPRDDGRAADPPGPTTAERSRALRHRVLRPHETIDEVAAREQPGDFFAGFERDGEVVAVGWVRPEGEPGEWRVGSMATDDAHQGQGLGARVLAALTDHAREQGAQRVWCNARMHAIGFYERQGWRILSDEPVWVSTVGEHRRMGRELNQ